MVRLNEKIMDILEKVADIKLKRGEIFQAKAYNTAYNNLVNANINIESINELKKISGFGPSILATCDEFIKTNKVKLIEDFKQDPLYIFTNIYGVGYKNAKKLIEEEGIKTLDELKHNTHLLNDKQKLGLKYYYDIMQRIPRDIIKEYDTVFKNSIPHLEGITKGKIYIEIVGSYRRGTPDSGDIDLIFSYEPVAVAAATTSASASRAMTESEYNTILANVFSQFIDNLIKENVILRENILAFGPSKCLVIAKIAQDKYYRRIDFLCAPKNEFAFSLLYFTGSKYFNTMMRAYISKYHLRLNEHGLYKIIGNDTDANNLVKVDAEFNTEKDIFLYVGLMYKAPHERQSGVDVIPIAELIVKFRTADKTLTESELMALYESAKYYYYNNYDKEIINFDLLTDAEFDILEDTLFKNKKEHQIGILPNKTKVKLPYFMPSLDKIKLDENTLNKWIEKYKGLTKCVISCKLDGNSIMFYNKNGECKLFTRGDGEMGQDITHILPYLKNIPNYFKSAFTSSVSASTNTNEICVRGELVISKDIFAKKYADKYKNARNLTKGLIDTKNIVPEDIQNISFIPYEVIYPKMAPIEQMKFLSYHKWDPVWYTVINIDKLTTNYLSEILQDKRESYKYDIDGLVVVANGIFKNDLNKNPEYAFAFKMVLDDQMAEVIVREVSWHPSKDGYLKPIVHYDPVHIRGATCTNANGINAAFINNNKIGVGAVIEVIRSGDVIPKITKMLQPAKVTSMPDPFLFGEYHWSENNVDYILNNPVSNEDVLIKNLERFFKVLKVEDLAEGNIKKLVANGYNDIGKIIKMSIDNYKTIPTFKDKMAGKLFKNVKEAIEHATLVDIMIATNIFGRGFNEKKINSIMENWPTLLIDYDKHTPDYIIQHLCNIPSIGLKTAELFTQNIPAFIDFLKNTDLYYKLTDYINNLLKHDKGNGNGNNSKTVQTPAPFINKNIVFSGFRSELLKNILADYGIPVNEAVTKNTACVIIPNELDETMHLTTKTQKAKALQIPIYTLNEFQNKYNSLLPV